MKTAILYRCHKQDENTLKHLEHLRQSNYDVYVAYDCTYRPLFDDAFNFTNDDLLANDYANAEHSQLEKIPRSMMPSLSPNIYFNTEQITLMWWKSNPEFQKYDFVWSIEYDIEFRGDWQNFFFAMSKDLSDFLGPYLMKYPQKHLYPGYWETFRTEIAEEHKFTSFGCIQRYSRDLLNFADNDCRNGFHGYYEQTMPTIAAIHGLSVTDINFVAETVTGQNAYHPFTLSGIRNDYLNNPEAAKQYENYLFHPVRY